MNPQDEDSTDPRLLQHYQRASGADPLVPSGAVRGAIFAEARRIAAQNRAAPRFGILPAVANRAHWKLAAFGSCAAGLLAVLLIAPHHPQRLSRGALTSSNLAAPAALPPSPAASAEQAAPPDFSGANRASAFSKTSPAAAVPADAAAQRSLSAARSAAQSGAPAAQKKEALNSAEADQASAAAHADAAALSAAVASADRERILSALDRGAGVDQVDELGRTPLMLATQNGQPQLVQLLLQRGADPSIADRSGRTPLQQARLAHRTDIVKLLEAANAR